MKYCIAIVLLAFSSGAFAEGCDYVAGTWQIDSYDDNLNAQVSAEYIFSDGGSLRIDFRIVSEDKNADENPAEGQAIRISESSYISRC